MKRLLVTSLIAATALVGMTAVASARPGNRSSHRSGNTSHYRGTRTYHAPRVTHRTYVRRNVVRHRVVHRPYYRPQVRRRVYRPAYRPYYRYNRAPRHVYYDHLGRRIVVW
ncbi:MAG: hypothetical protein KC503_07690 [Myxococcales bacterium]|nr:hypothetical protein [Myxococcales bacterium]